MKVLIFSWLNSRICKSSFFNMINQFSNGIESKFNLLWFMPRDIAKMSYVFIIASEITCHTKLLLCNIIQTIITRPPHVHYWSCRSWYFYSFCHWHGSILPHYGLKCQLVSLQHKVVVNNCDSHGLHYLSPCTHAKVVQCWTYYTNPNDETLPPEPLTTLSSTNLSLVRTTGPQSIFLMATILPL